jgi:hypothetical protein
MWGAGTITSQTLYWQQGFVEWISLSSMSHVLESPPAFLPITSANHGSPSTNPTLPDSMTSAPTGMISPTRQISGIARYRKRLVRPWREMLVVFTTALFVSVVYEFLTGKIHADPTILISRLLADWTLACGCMGFGLLSNDGWRGGYQWHCYLYYFVRIELTWKSSLEVITNAKNETRTRARYATKSTTHKPIVRQDHTNSVIQIGRAPCLWLYPNTLI